MPPSSAGSQGAEHTMVVQACRRDAALLLGADASVAQQFGDSGMVLMGDTPLSLQPLHSDPSGPWIAFTQAKRPADVSEDAWCEALLRATRHCLTVTHAAYGLTDLGDAVLTLRTPAGHGHADLLAAEMAGLLNLRQALLNGISASGTLRHTQPPAVVTAAPENTTESPSSNAQEFEAPDEVLALVHSALLRLGLPAPQAQAAVRTGELSLEGVNLGLACGGDTPTLVVVADLGAHALDTADKRKQALQANAGLMAAAGVAVAREHGLAHLMARCDLTGHRAEVLASWLRHFARLAKSTANHGPAATPH
ncbi:hypothetical protein [Hydrogenophaga soli]